MLSDPIRVLRVRSRKKRNQRGDPFISAITCTALSDDGHRVALGFDDGVVEVVDAELGTTISRSELRKPPVWLLFIDGGHKLVIENSKGDICIWDIFTLHRRRFASRIHGSTMVVASLSHDGSMIVRAAWHSTKEWYENMYIIHITTDRPTIHSLSAPPHIIPYRGMFPLQRSVGFSPNGQYAAAFDTMQAFVWSSISFQLIARYSVEDPRDWFLNTSCPSPVPPLALPNDVITTPFPELPGPIRSTSCILFNLGTRPADWDSSLEMHALSLAAAAAPILGSQNGVWFRGHAIITIPSGYRISKWHSIPRAPRRSARRRLDMPANISLPTSKDGTRFLICDEEGCPVLIDISGVISNRAT